MGQGTREWAKHITTVHPNAGRLEAKIRGAGINKNAIWANHGAYIAHYRIQDRLRGQMNQKAQTSNLNGESIEGPGKQYTPELTRLAVKSFSRSNDPVRWITGKCHGEKDLSLPMPSKYPTATPIDFGKLFGIPSFIGPKTQWLLAYEISAVFDVSEIMFVSFNPLLGNRKLLQNQEFKPFSPLVIMEATELQRVRLICKSQGTTDYLICSWQQAVNFDEHDGEESAGQGSGPEPLPLWKVK